MRRSILKSPLSEAALIAVALAIGAGIVYASTTVGLFSIGANVSNSQIAPIYVGASCASITHSGSNTLLVPTATAGEWNAFVAHAPGISVGSCCASNSGQGCTSSANSCGQTNSGTIQCNGSCSATTPANPSYYGQACASTPNSCGQTNSGTYNCSDVCSASTPANPAGYGNSCTSAPNSCGQTNSGTIQCNGTCSAATPSNSGCPTHQCFDVSADYWQFQSDTYDSQLSYCQNGLYSADSSFSGTLTCDTNGNNCTYGGVNVGNWSDYSNAQNQCQDTPSYNLAYWASPTIYSPGYVFQKVTSISSLYACP